MNNPIVVLLALVGFVLCAHADVRLPAALGDHMVLQQDCEVTLWGWAYEGETVLVETSWGVKTQTVADASGEWRVKVKTPPARPLDQGIHAEAITFTVPDENRVQIKDVLIGEVWLCSGQSNMTMMLGPDYPAGHNDWFGDKYWPEESHQMDRPAIRVFNVEKTARAAPQDDCKAVLPDHITLPGNAQGLAPDLRTGWQACTRETAPYMSAVAYYFGVRLQEKLDVPVGLVTSTVGGSPIEAWISLDALRQIPACATLTNKVHRTGAAALFNGMIAPLTQMTVRGVLWYQGESNVGASAVNYAVLLKTLIADWRGRFAQTLPFGIVQLANYGTSPADTRAAIVRAAQAEVAAEAPDTGLTVAIDLGEERIHPPNKRDVANRLALWARATIYGETNLVHQSPRYQSHAVEGGTIRIRFNTGGSPLRVGTLDDSGGVNPAPGQKLQWFEIAGADGNFVPADAVIDGDSVVVSSPGVSAPTTVRYAWATNPQGCNLYNEAGLPACPFSTGAETPGAKSPGS